MNEWVGIGRLGADAEMRHTPSGATNAKFSLAIPRKWKDKNSGEWKEETTWINCILWNPGKVHEYMKRGTQIAVKGRISVRSIGEDEGKKRYFTEIIAESIQLLGGKTDNNAETPPMAKPMALEISDDDIPF